jgi:hypothetical protein
MNESVVEPFLQFYYSQLNEKRFEQIIPHLKEHSTFSREQLNLKGTENIINSLNMMNGHFEPKKVTYLMSGDRRVNIVVSGIFNHQYIFCEFLHLAYGNDKSYWIQSSILQMVH